MSYPFVNRTTTYPQRHLLIGQPLVCLLISTDVQGPVVELEDAKCLVGGLYAHGDGSAEPDGRPAARVDELH